MNLVYFDENGNKILCSTNQEYSDLCCQRYLKSAGLDPFDLLNKICIHIPYQELDEPEPLTIMHQNIYCLLKQVHTSFDLEYECFNFEIFADFQVEFENLLLDPRVLQIYWMGFTAYPEDIWDKGIAKNYNPLWQIQCGFGEFDPNQDSFYVNFSILSNSDKKVKTPIEKIKFSSKIKASLKRSGIDYIEQIEKMTDFQILELQGIAKGNLREIRLLVHQFRQADYL